MNTNIISLIQLEGIFDFFFLYLQIIYQSIFTWLIEFNKNESSKILSNAAYI